MAKLKVQKEKDQGWTDYVSPKMTGYRLACCDCGLVHDMEFFAVRIVKKNDDGSFEYEELDREKFRVVFRARRNKRSTGQVRRWNHNILCPQELMKTQGVVERL